jgi:regulator of extracellular matrix RemA (YlzA/DUF370 family)
MFLHIGERKVVSDTKIVGIFNYETLKRSQINEKIVNYVEKEQCDIKTIVIDTDNRVIFSKVSPFTVIKRDSFDDNDMIWRKG